MAKFNKRDNFGGIFYQAKPTGFRKYCFLYKVIPYFLGYDININLLMKRTELNTWWNEGVLQAEYLGKSESYPFAIGKSDEKGKWSQTFRIAHPRQPCTVICSLQLQNVEETNNYLKPKIMRATGASLVEDIRVISLHTALGWGIGIILGISAIIVGVLNLVFRI